MLKRIFLRKYAKGKQFFLFQKIFASNTKQGFSILNLSEDYQSIFHTGTRANDLLQDK